MAEASPTDAEVPSLPKVLLVDDELPILRSTAMIVEALGYDVATCNRAEDILAAVAREEPDILLQDVRMPGLLVEAMMPAVRARAPDIRIILFSASLELDDVAEAAGVAHTLEKPFSPIALQKALRDALAAPEATPGMMATVAASG